MYNRRRGPVFLDAYNYTLKLLFECIQHQPVILVLVLVLDDSLKT